MHIYFYCNHPYPLEIFHAISLNIRQYNQDIKQHIIFSKHVYFEKIDYADYLNVFDSVDFVPYITYNRNVFKDLKKWAEFKRNLKKCKIENDSVAFTISYSDLGTNIFCRYVKEKSKNTKLIHFTIYGNFLNVANARFNRIRTFFDSINVVLLKGYFLKTYVDSRNVLVDKIYFNDPHDKIFQLSSNAINNKYETIPYPVVKQNEISLDNSKMVIFYGNLGFLDWYQQVDPEIYYASVNKYLKKMVDIYKDKGVKLYYKPHPVDGDVIPKELDLEHFEIFPEKLTAETIYSKYFYRIVATYTVTSLACITSTHFGIPSYVLSDDCGIPEEIKMRFKDQYQTANQDYFIEVSNVNDIASIDNKKTDVNINEIRAIWNNFFDKIFPFNH